MFFQCMIMGRKGSKRKHSADPLPSDVVLAELVQCSTKTGMVAALSSLGKAGWLNEDVVKLTASNDKIRRGLRKAQIKHSEATTPYGAVVQSISTRIKGLESWQICHPMALFYHLSTISSFFFRVVLDIRNWCCTQGRHLYRRHMSRQSFTT